MRGEYALNFATVRLDHDWVTQVVKLIECMVARAVRKDANCQKIVIRACLKFLYVCFDPSSAANVFTKFYDGRDEYLSQCFANFITLATVTKESNLLTDDVKELYFSIIASQIHPCEVSLLFYYFHVGKGYSAKSLFSDLGLPRKIDQNLLADKDHLFLFNSDEEVKDILTKNIRG